MNTCNYYKTFDFLYSGHLTLADIAFVSTFSTIVASEAFDLSAYNPELNEWFEKCKALIPNFDKANDEGAVAFGGWYKSKVAASKS
jgi:glutathione S-transferase